MDDRSFTKAYLAVQPSLLAYARKLTKSAERCDDLLQDANVRIWTKRHLYVEGNFYGWCKVLMRNVYINQQEVESRMKFTENTFINGKLDGGTPDDSGDTHRDDMMHRYLRQEPNQEDFWLENRINESIATHLPSHSALLIQKRLQGMDYKKIAKVLGITPNNAKQRHFNDTKILRKVLLQLGLVD